MSAPKRTKASYFDSPSSFAAAASSSSSRSPSPAWRWCFCLDHHPFHSSQCLALTALIDPDLAESQSQEPSEITQECLAFPSNESIAPIPNLLASVEEALEELLSEPNEEECSEPDD